MTAIADTGPGQLIRWHYLGYPVVALGVMTVAIASHDHWFLNFQVTLQAERKAGRDARYAARKSRSKR